ncbi:hypothetical protein SB6413_00809 [Klebsiella pasteurii]|nr:hypothetical protein SB6413_00809 [Klebsiella pasteurii]
MVRSKDKINGFNISIGNIQADCAGIIPHMRYFPRAGNRDDIIAFTHHPCECELGQGTAIFIGYLPQLTEQLLVFLQGIVLEAREIATKIIIGEAGPVGDFSR